MWRDYIKGAVKHNRASSLSVTAAALIAATFLSLLCCLFYNAWAYDVEQIVLDEGAWQGRVTGALDDADVAVIRAYPNVKSAVVNAPLSQDGEIAVDIVFDNARAAYRDMPQIAQMLGLPADAADYHALLLSRYLIHDPQDDSPPLLLAFYLLVLCMVSLSLILIIRHAFAVSMQTRVRQLGILSSIGATPRQIRACLMREAATLCMIPALLGALIGVALGALTVRASHSLVPEATARHAAAFRYHPLVFAGTLLFILLTVFVSARLPAGRLSRMTPLDAIRNAGELRLKRKKRSPVLSLLFGMEGELAGNALRAQRKALRTSALALTLSFLGFSLMLCFFTLSDISTNHTYFERYKDAWDVMATVRNARIAELPPMEPLSELPDVESALMYQKAAAKCRVPEEWQSEPLRALGGLSAVAGAYAPIKDGVYTVRAPIVILDDAAFAAYCKQVGAAPGQSGAVVVNRIWDSVHSGFRYRAYIPYLDASQPAVSIKGVGSDTLVELPVLAYANEAPVLREEYDDYALVLVMPAAVWEGVRDQLGGAEPDTYIRMLATDRDDVAGLRALESRVIEHIGAGYAVESENRLQEKLDNDRMLFGYRLLLGALCALLAVIGLANVFANTLGFLRQRKREFARYLSVGMTPRELRKMLFIEALTVALRPVFITLPLTAAAVGLMISASSLDPAEFLAQAPALPMLLFIAAIFGFVALAYYVGGKRALSCNLAETLRDETV